MSKMSDPSLDVSSFGIDKEMTDLELLTCSYTSVSNPRDTNLEAGVFAWLGSTASQQFNKDIVLMRPPNTSDDDMIKGNGRGGRGKGRGRRSGTDKHDEGEGGRRNEEKHTRMDAPSAPAFGSAIFTTVFVGRYRPRIRSPYNTPMIGPRSIVDKLPIRSLLLSDIQGHVIIDINISTNSNPNHKPRRQRPTIRSKPSSLCYRLVQPLFAFGRELQTVVPAFRGKVANLPGYVAIGQQRNNWFLVGGIKPHECFGRFAYSYSQAQKRSRGRIWGLFKGIKASAIQAVRKGRGTENVVDIVVTGHSTSGAC
ncbi:hypothetical protein BDN71DRAFT_1434844 [Pleurotus eryngii]|uniref:Uncharacterized protein n=1 Tax=Pleurotus eryngii TaxID=5323 RepID=A0A9P5ZMT9_PLEER|nr:hypothetical protein BDN71DRAFT_1434844 [Pleurotus eryngii]